MTEEDLREVANHRESYGKGYDDGFAEGQEAMRERCMKFCSEQILQARMCAGGDVDMRDLSRLESHLLRAIRALEVE